MATRTQRTCDECNHDVTRGYNLVEIQRETEINGILLPVSELCVRCFCQRVGVSGGIRMAAIMEEYASFPG